MTAPFKSLDRTSAFTAAGQDVLAVIPCLNEAAHLETLLNGLLAEAALPKMLIVVVDGGSTDDSRKIVQRFAIQYDRVRLLENAQRLQSAAVNLAASLFGSGRRWMVRLDGHCGYPPNYVTMLLNAAQRDDADSVVVSMRAHGETCFQIAAALAQNSRLGTGGSPHRGGAPSGWVDHGHHALFRLDSFISNKGYDAGFSHNEDAEYDIRLLERGGRIWLASEAEILYFPRRNVAALFRQYLKYGAGRARTTLLHRRPLKLRQLLPLGVAPAVFIAPLAVVAWPFGVPAAFWAAACLVAGVIIGRGRVCQMLSGAPAMIMHFAWSLGFLSQLLRPRRPSKTLSSS